MSKPTAQNLHRKELKRKKERKLSKLYFSTRWFILRKRDIKARVDRREENSKMMSTHGMLRGVK
jgi:hypothetical protein